jgi:TPP-dependent pyruvate/acetoin dehydrogenase alpha subunit
MTYRLKGRTPTRPSKHLRLGEEGGRSESDPILNMERYLADKGLFHEGLKAGIVAAFTKDLDAAIGKARKAPLPGRLR